MENIIVPIENIIVPIVVIPTIFLGLPWMVFHYITKWKMAATLTNDDERMLDEINALSRRLEERLETVERLTAQDNPDWSPRQFTKKDTEKYLMQKDNQFDGRS